MQTIPVLYIDAHLIVVDKPAGLAVHPGPKTPRSLEDRLGELTFGFKRLPIVAHRLDRDTSGCLCLARHPKAAKRLGHLFAEGMVGKTYLAILDGATSGSAGTIDAPLAKRSTREAGWRIVVSESGLPARTDWRLLGIKDGKSLVVFEPNTGRTHQIRVHAAYALAPIEGDPVYGAIGDPMRLHAARVVIPYSRQLPAVDVMAPLPESWPEWARKMAIEAGLSHVCRDEEELGT